jgi:hypothetical protein
VSERRTDLIGLLPKEVEALMRKLASPLPGTPALSVVHARRALDIDP